MSRASRILNTAATYLMGVGEGIEKARAINGLRRAAEQEHAIRREVIPEHREPDGAPAQQTTAPFPPDDEGVAKVVTFHVFPEEGVGYAVWFKVRPHDMEEGFVPYVRTCLGRIEAVLAMDDEGETQD